MNFNDSAHAQTPPSRRAPIVTDCNMGYTSYNQCSVDLGLDNDPASSGISPTRLSFEIRKATDHTRLSIRKHGSFEEVLIYPDQSVIQFHKHPSHDIMIQTVYSPTGEIENLAARYSQKSGLLTKYEHFSYQAGQHEACHEKWEHYNALLTFAESRIAKNPECSPAL